MQSEFVDRLLTCVDCHGQFVFTAGEQIFFLDKQFKNDPKCKRAALGARAGSAPVAAGIARTETRTECSECHIETTVPFKPTQGRPVLCRQCFQTKRAQAASTPATAAEMIAATSGLDLQTPTVDAVNQALQHPQA
jgi:CxxC-x17-CxxC domain-containing protein